MKPASLATAALLTTTPVAGAQGVPLVGAGARAAAEPGLTTAGAPEHLWDRCFTAHRKDVPQEIRRYAIRPDHVSRGKIVRARARNVFYTYGETGLTDDQAGRQHGPHARRKISHARVRADQGYEEICKFVPVKSVIRRVLHFRNSSPDRGLAHSGRNLGVSGWPGGQRYSLLSYSSLHLIVRVRPAATGHLILQRYGKGRFRAVGREVSVARSTGMASVWINGRGRYRLSLTARGTSSAIRTRSVTITASHAKWHTTGSNSRIAAVRYWPGTCRSSGDNWYVSFTVVFSDGSLDVADLVSDGPYMHSLNDSKRDYIVPDAYTDFPCGP